jgi:hypothetical protein
MTGSSPLVAHELCFSLESQPNPRSAHGTGHSILTKEHKVSFARGLPRRLWQPGPWAIGRAAGATAYQIFCRTGNRVEGIVPKWEGSGDPPLTGTMSHLRSMSQIAKAG